MQLQGQWQRRCSHQSGQLLLLEERPKKLRGECSVIAVVLGLMQMLVVLIVLCLTALFLC